MCVFVFVLCVLLSSSYVVVAFVVSVSRYIFCTLAALLTAAVRLLVQLLQNYCRAAVCSCCMQLSAVLLYSYLQSYCAASVRYLQSYCTDHTVQPLQVCRDSSVRMWCVMCKRFGLDVMIKVADTTRPPPILTSSSTHVRGLVIGGTEDG